MRRASLLVAVAFVAACGSSEKKPAAVARVETRPLPVVKAVPAESEDAEPPSVASHVVATLGAQKSIGPYLAKGAQGGLLAYVVGDKTARQLTTVPLAADGTPRAEPHVVTTLPAEPTEFALGAGGTGADFFAVYATLVDRGEALSIAALGADGAAKATPVEIARTQDPIQWLTVVPVAGGAICVWVEEPGNKTRNVFAVAVDAQGKARSLPTRVANGVRAWQVVPTASGVGVAMLVPESAPRNAPAPVAVKWRALDGEAKAQGDAVTITSSASDKSDLDAVRTASGVLFAWTDRGEEDPEVMLAGLTDAGAIVAPTRAMRSLGGALAVKLLATPGAPTLAWVEAQPRPSGAYRMHLAKVSLSPLGAEDASTFEFWRYATAQGPELPELDADDKGLGALMLAQTCTTAAAPSPRDPACATERAATPTFVRFDDKLSPVQTEAVRLGEEHDPATLAWSMSCDAGRCLALAATNESPLRVRTVDFVQRATPWLPPVVPPLPANAPRVVALKTLATDEAYADVEAVRVGDGTMLATLAYPKDGAEGGAIAVRVYDAKGEAAATAPVVITRRALETGGVAMAAGGKPEDGAAIAWTAKDRGVVQVHVTRVDRNGRRTNDVQLTGERGGTSDVAIAWAGDGWALAWVDARDGNGEVYAAKVDTGLNRTSHEERITSAPGDAVDVTMLPLGDKLMIAWGDPRENPKDGYADIYVRPISGKDAKPAGDEVHVMGTAAHSRSPALAPAGDGGLWVGWVEDAPTGLDSPTGSGGAAYGAIVAKLDPQGKPIGEPAHAPTGGTGRAVAIALDVDAAGRVRGYIARSDRTELDLDAFDVAAMGAGAFPLLTLGGVGLDASIDVLGDSIYYDDHGPRPGEKRLRRATVQWRP